MPSSAPGPTVWLVDSCVVIGYLRGQPACRESVEAVRDGRVAGLMSAVTVLELLVGVRLARDVRRAHDEFLAIRSWFAEVVPVDEAVAARAAEVHAALRASSQAIEVRDLLIAATALVRGVAVKTLDRRHFSRIPGIDLA